MGLNVRELWTFYFLWHRHPIEGTDCFRRCTVYIDVNRGRCRPPSTSHVASYSVQLSIIKVKRAFFRHDRRTAPKFGTHVWIDTLTLKKLTHPTPGGCRGLSIVKNLSRQMWSFLPVMSRHWFIARWSFRKIVILTSQLHYFMLLCTGSSHGKSVQAPIWL